MRYSTRSMVVVFNVTIAIRFACPIDAAFFGEDLFKPLLGDDLIMIAAVLGPVVVDEIIESIHLDDDIVARAVIKWSAMEWDREVVYSLFIGRVKELDEVLACCLAFVGEAGHELFNFLCHNIYL